jgi:hypothetical protein
MASGFVLLSLVRLHSTASRCSFGPGFCLSLSFRNGPHSRLSATVLIVGICYPFMQEEQPERRGWRDAMVHLYQRTSGIILVRGNPTDGLSSTSKQAQHDLSEDSAIKPLSLRCSSLERLIVDWATTKPAPNPLEKLLSLFTDDCVY